MLLDDEGPGASDRRVEMQEWRKRHAIWSAAASGVSPDIWIRRQSDPCGISFDPGVTVGAPRSFEFQFGRGSVLLDIDIVARAFGAFLRWGRTAGSPVHVDTLLPNDGEAAACAAERWLIGDHLSDVLKRAGVQTSRLQDGVIPPSSPEVAMFGTVRPDLGVDDAHHLLAGLDGARSDAPEPPAVEALTSSMSPPTADTAWEQGYDLALRTLEALDATVAASGSVDVAVILPRLGSASKSCKSGTSA